MNKKKVIIFITSILLFSNLILSINLWNFQNPYNLFKNINPKVNSLQVKITSGTKYAVSDYMDLEIQVTNELGQPVSNANCEFNLYYPNKTLFQQATSTYLAYGIYYNNSIKAPSITGVYTYSVNCSYDTKTAYTSKCLQVKNKLVPFSGAVVVPCDFFLNSSEEDYNSYKEYVTTIKDEGNLGKITSVLKICWKE